MKRGLAFGGTALAFALVASGAQAATLGVSDARPVAGQNLVVNGGGCQPGVRVTVKGFGITTIGTARPDGTFDVAFDVPRGADVGDVRTITARCWDGDSPRHFDATVRVSHEMSGPSNVDPGELVTVRGGGCAPNVRVIISFRGFDVRAGNADGDGDYRVSFRVPSGARAGDATIAARCDQVYPPGSRHVDRRVVTVG